MSGSCHSPMGGMTAMTALGRSLIRRPSDDITHRPRTRCVE
jgi:hypothetical protein